MGVAPNLKTPTAVPATGQSSSCGLADPFGTSQILLYPQLGLGRPRPLNCTANCSKASKNPPSSAPMGLPEPTKACGSIPHDGAGCAPGKLTRAKAGEMRTFTFPTFQSFIGCCSFRWLWNGAIWVGFGHWLGSLKLHWHRANSSGHVAVSLSKTVPPWL